MEFSAWPELMESDELATDVLRAVEQIRPDDDVDWRTLRIRADVRDRLEGLHGLSATIRGGPPPRSVGAHWPAVVLREAQGLRLEAARADLADLLERAVEQPPASGSWTRVYVRNQLDLAALEAGASDEQIAVSRAWVDFCYNELMAEALEAAPVIGGPRAVATDQWLAVHDDSPAVLGNEVTHFPGLQSLDWIRVEEHFRTAQHPSWQQWTDEAERERLLARVTSSELGVVGTVIMLATGRSNVRGLRYVGRLARLAGFLFMTAVVPPLQAIEIAGATWVAENASRRVAGRQVREVVATRLEDRLVPIYRARLIERDIEAQRLSLHPD
jgi:hypothetical protein